MGWIKWVVFALEIAPKVLELVKKVEETIGGGQGEVKKSIVVSAVEAAAPEPAAVGIVGEMVDKQVSVLNEAGIFKHSGEVSP